MAALAIYVRLHDGRYHGRGDWPPSPARLFQALVAGAGLSGPLQEKEREALRWLEALPAPIIADPRAWQPRRYVCSTCQITTAMRSQVIRQGWRRFGPPRRFSGHISSIPEFRSCMRGPWDRTRRINKTWRRFAALPSACISSDAALTWPGHGAKRSTMASFNICWQLTLARSCAPRRRVLARFFKAHVRALWKVSIDVTGHTRSGSLI